MAGSRGRCFRMVSQELVAPPSSKLTSLFKPKEVLPLLLSVCDLDFELASMVRGCGVRGGY